MLFPRALISCVNHYTASIDFCIGSFHAQQFIVTSRDNPLLSLAPGVLYIDKSLKLINHNTRPLSTQSFLWSTVCSTF